MTFKESPRFPDSIARGAEGGPLYNTEIAELASGHEQRNIGWSLPRYQYTVSINTRVLTEIATYRAFFHAVKGAAIGFRIRDPLDYVCLSGEGRLGPLTPGGTTGVGSGSTVYQLYKRYTSGSDTFDRSIGKPVSGQVIVYRNAAPMSVSGTAGQLASIDTTQGIITFNADTSSNIFAITKANPGKITTTGAHGLSSGQAVYLSSIGGMTELNETTVTVTVVDADEFTIGVNTTSYTTFTSGGTVKKGPQAADALTWSGQFDVPVRFKSDWFRAIAEAHAHGSWPNIELIEIKDLT